MTSGTYRILPVSKPIRVVLRVSTDHRDEGVPHQAEHEENLEEGQVEFSDSKVANCQTIEAAVHWSASAKSENQRT